jgi:hypothetical protein
MRTFLAHLVFPYGKQNEYQMFVADDGISARRKAEQLAEQSGASGYFLYEQICYSMLTSKV